MQKVLEIPMIQKRATPVLRRHGVRKASIFGSVARGDSGSSSDIDLVIDLKPIGLAEFITLRDLLADVLGRSVDLVTYRSLHPLIRDKVLKEQVVIYEKGS